MACRFATATSSVSAARHDENLSGGITVADAVIQPGAPTGRTTMVCRLRHRVGRWGPSPKAGEVELENVSPGVIEIDYDMHPLQYFDLVVTDAGGNVISDRPYSHRFSPLGSSR